MFNSTKLLLANTMMIGVIMTICSNNWLSMWMGLEISLLSFIPFIQNSNKMSSESMIKYFIIQSVASTLFLLSVVVMLIGVNMMNELILTISMLIKLGMAPFHNWVIFIIENMNYYTMFYLLTLMKIPPISILYQINLTKYFTMSIIMSMIISSISCLNQTSIRKTLGYSSIYNMSLMLTMVKKFNMMMSFMLIYSLILMMLTEMINKTKTNFINQITFNDFNIWLKVNLWINMLSMGGFPPLMGFVGKLLVIQILLEQNQFSIVFIMLMTSMLVMMFYMRMVFSSMLMNFSFKKWMLIEKNMMYMIVFNAVLPILSISMASIT